MVLFLVAKVAADGTSMVGEVNGIVAMEDATRRSRHVEALAEGGAWGAVYNALKGPIMARAVQLQSGAGGKKQDATREGAVSPDLAACLDDMARCAEVRASGKSNASIHHPQPGISLFVEAADGRIPHLGNKAGRRRGFSSDITRMQRGGAFVE